MPAVTYESSGQPLPQALNHTGGDLEWPFSETSGKGCPELSKAM